MSKVRSTKTLASQIYAAASKIEYVAIILKDEKNSAGHVIGQTIGYKPNFVSLGGCAKHWKKHPNDLYWPRFRLMGDINNMYSLLVHEQLISPDETRLGVMIGQRDGEAAVFLAESTQLDQDMVPANMVPIYSLALEQNGTLSINLTSDPASPNTAYGMSVEDFLAYEAAKLREYKDYHKPTNTITLDQLNEIMLRHKNKDIDGTRLGERKKREPSPGFGNNRINGNSVVDRINEVYEEFTASGQPVYLDVTKLLPEQSGARRLIPNTPGLTSSYIFAEPAIEAFADSDEKYRIVIFKPTVTNEATKSLIMNYYRLRFGAQATAKYNAAIENGGVKVIAPKSGKAKSIKRVKVLSLAEQQHAQSIAQNTHVGHVAGSGLNHTHLTSHAASPTPATQPHFVGQPSFGTARRF